MGPKSGPETATMLFMILCDINGNLAFKDLIRFLAIKTIVLWILNKTIQVCINSFVNVLRSWLNTRIESWDST